MLTAILRFFGLLPSTVDDALASIGRALAQLETVASAKIAEAEGHAATVKSATAAQSAAQDEADRAARAHAAISALVA